MFDNLAFPVLAIILGIKHAYDLDHILVISNIIMNKSRNIDTVKIIGFWTTGHMVTVGIITIIIYYYKVIIPQIHLPQQPIGLRLSSCQS